MNNDRRQSIRVALGKIAEARALLEIARDEEQAYHDNMPEGIQSGSKGDRATETIDALETAIGELEGIEGNVKPDEM